MKTIQCIALALGFVAISLSGCTGKSDAPAPSPTTSAATTAPAPTTSSSPAPRPPAPAEPGIAHKANYSYQSDSNIPQATFQINQTWTTLEFQVQMFKSAQCGVLQAEPPAGTGTGPQPQITFTSPSGQKVGPVDLGTYSSCDVNTHNKVGITPPAKTAAAEMGAWKIDFNGRGVNMYAQVIVAGS